MKTLSLHFSQNSGRSVQSKEHLLIFPVPNRYELPILLEEFQRSNCIIVRKRNLFFCGVVDFYSALCIYLNYLSIHQDATNSIYLVVYPHVLSIPEIYQFYTRIVFTGYTCQVYFSNWSQVYDFVSFYAKSLLETETLPA